MKVKFLIPILSAVFLGYICANFVLHEYKYSPLVQDTKVYFLQIGAYNNLESSKNDLNNIVNKITVKENNKYYSYIGMTANLNQAERIKELYKKNNIEVYIKKVDLKEIDFVQELEQYDILLENSKNLDEINSVLETVLATYEENITSL